jgi:1,4-dihydroxy-2-naphthoyl-CoA synthase
MLAYSAGVCETSLSKSNATAGQAGVVVTCFICGWVTKGSVCVGAQAAKEVDEQIRSIEAETGLQRHYRCVPDFTKKEVAEHQWSWLDGHAGGGPAEATACKSKDGHS